MDPGPETNGTGVEHFSKLISPRPNRVCVLSKVSKVVVPNAQVPGHFNAKEQKKFVIGLGSLGLPTRSEQWSSNHYFLDRFLKLNKKNEKHVQKMDKNFFVILVFATKVLSNETDLKKNKTSKKLIMTQTICSQKKVLPWSETKGHFIIIFALALYLWKITSYKLWWRCFWILFLLAYIWEFYILQENLMPFYFKNELMFWVVKRDCFVVDSQNCLATFYLSNLSKLVYCKW